MKKDIVDFDDFEALVEQTIKESIDRNGSKVTKGNLFMTVNVMSNKIQTGHGDILDGDYEDEFEESPRQVKLKQK